MVELWSARTAALGSREDVAYVFVFENRGRMIGATIDHPHSQILAFGTIPPIAQAELEASDATSVRIPATASWSPAATAGRPPCRGALVAYELLISPISHVADLPTAGPQLRAGLAAMLVDALTRMERLLGPDTPYMLWVHQRPNDGADWPAAHLHLHLAPALRAPGSGPAPRLRRARRRRLLRSGRSAAGRGPAGGLPVNGLNRRTRRLVRQPVRPRAGRRLVRARPGQPDRRPGLHRDVRAALRPRPRGLRRRGPQARPADRAGVPAEPAATRSCWTSTHSNQEK